MYYFTSDYTEGCAPEILAALTKTNMEQTGGYGEDPYCQAAKELIKAACQAPEAAVHFFMGGTQTNLTVICAALRPCEAVYGSVQSHINTHEAGAIERTGHKVLTLETPDGKLTAAQIEKAYSRHLIDPSREHLAQPKMVYISQSTEIGSLYHRAELEDLYAVCQKYGLFLFIDGARLAYALAAPDNDMTLADIAHNCDVFYIGGTKCGALFGEAVVIMNPALGSSFFTIQKQGGAVLAKGRLLGVQYQELFTNNLYQRLGQHGTTCALKLKDALTAAGIPFLTDSTTNQQFPIFTREQFAKLSRDFVLSEIDYTQDDRIVARICTSWATSMEQVDRLIEQIQAL